MKNKLTDLNDILFAQLERLSDEGLSPDALQSELSRTQSVVQLSDRIIDNARLQLDAVRLIAQNGADLGKHMPLTLALPSGDKPVRL